MGEIDILIEKFNAGEITSIEELQLERHIAAGEVNLSQLKALEAMQMKLEALPTPDASSQMDDRFYSLLNEEKSKAKAAPNTFIVWWVSMKQSQWQWAYSAALVILGIALGTFYNRSSHNEINTLTSEMHEMKEMMMLSMLEKESTTDRLRAVSLTNEMGTTSEKVAMALINTLRTDNNNNVRMAAIEALSHYTSQPAVRKELIASIQFQKSPLVQLALAELMVAMNEKGAKKAFDQLWKSDDTPQEIKTAIKEKMQTMI
ncbi:MAG TPA: HEAT repeat domain-containing protein [Fulvivirga sp.]|nr:HEAT repeat domain-containing protein [Fulvivirga sp.]